MPRWTFATWKGNGRSGGSYIGLPYRAVLHTTETEGMPSYSSGLTAPHFTYNPKNRTFVQHTDTATAARALRNLSGGVQTNRANALQLEIICYSAKWIADAAPARRLWVGALPDSAYEDIREWLTWCSEVHGITPTSWPGKSADSSSKANAAGFRMTTSQWNAFNGVCGHQHVPENIHWDPGALKWDKVIKTSTGDDDIGWQWNDGEGSPIREVSPDADDVFEFQGSFFGGHNVGSYLLTTSEANYRRGMLLGAARMAEEIMKIRDDLKKNGINPR